MQQSMPQKLVYLTKDGTTNTSLSIQVLNSDEDADAVIFFSKGDLTINGSGTQTLMPRKTTVLKPMTAFSYDWRYLIKTSVGIVNDDLKHHRNNQTIEC